MVKEDEFSLGNDEILGGLKTAIAKGESLKDAMMTFYQAGYDKSEIEEAARAYLNQKPLQNQTDVTKRIPEKIEEKEEPKEEKKPLMKIPPKKPVVPEKTKTDSGLANKKEKEQKSLQKVSEYSPPKKKKKKSSGRGLTIFLGIMLLFLVGVLIAVIAFKSELIEFFNSFFG